VPINPNARVEQFRQPFGDIVDVSSVGQQSIQALAMAHRNEAQALMSVQEDGQRMMERLSQSASGMWEGDSDLFATKLARLDQAYKGEASLLLSKKTKTPEYAAARKEKVAAFADVTSFISGSKQLSAEIAGISKGKKDDQKRRYDPNKRLEDLAGKTSIEIREQGLNTPEAWLNKFNPIDFEKFNASLTNGYKRQVVVDKNTVTKSADGTTSTYPAYSVPLVTPSAYGSALQRAVTDDQKASNLVAWYNGLDETQKSNIVSKYNAMFGLGSKQNEFWQSDPEMRFTGSPVSDAITLSVMDYATTNSPLPVKPVDVTDKDAIRRLQQKDRISAMRESDRLARARALMSYELGVKRDAAKEEASGIGDETFGDYLSYAVSLGDDGMVESMLKAAEQGGIRPGSMKVISNSKIASGVASTIGQQSQKVPGYTIQYEVETGKKDGSPVYEKVTREVKADNVYAEAERITTDAKINMKGDSGKAVRSSLSGKKVASKPSSTATPQAKPKAPSGRGGGSLNPKPKRN